MDKLEMLFLRMLYDIGRGYGAPQIREFIKYIIELKKDEKEKIKIVKKALQIAVAGKKANDEDLALKLVDKSFKDDIDKEKIKKFVKILITHREISDTRLRDMYLRSLTI